MNTENKKIVVLTPAAGSVYSFSWSRMKKYFLDLFLITIIVAVQLACSGGDGVVSDDPVVVENNPTTSLTCTLNQGAPGCQ